MIRAILAGVVVVCLLLGVFVVLVAISARQSLLDADQDLE